MSGTFGNTDSMLEMLCEYEILRSTASKRDNTRAVVSQTGVLKSRKLSKDSIQVAMKNQGVALNVQTLSLAMQTSKCNHCSTKQKQQSMNIPEISP